MTGKRHEGRDRVRAIARWGLRFAGVALAAGLLAGLAGFSSFARASVLTGLLTIVALPVINVVAEVVEEVRRREWIFLGVAAAVLTILIYNVGHLLLW